MDNAQNFTFALTAFQTAVIGAFWLWFRSREDKFVTKDYLKSALANLSNEIKLHMATSLDGPDGYVRKATCLLVHEKEK